MTIYQTLAELLPSSAQAQAPTGLSKALISSNTPTHPDNIKMVTIVQVIRGIEVFQVSHEDKNDRNGGVWQS